MKIEDNLKFPTISSYAVKDELLIKYWFKPGFEGSPAQMWCGKYYFVFKVLGFLRDKQQTFIESWKLLSILDPSWFWKAQQKIDAIQIQAISSVVRGLLRQHKEICICSCITFIVLFYAFWSFGMPSPPPVCSSAFPLERHSNTTAGSHDATRKKHSSRFNLVFCLYIPAVVQGLICVHIKHLVNNKYLIRCQALESILDYLFPCCCFFSCLDKFDFLHF